jgi:hypothetical protein
VKNLFNRQIIQEILRFAQLRMTTKGLTMQATHKLAPMGVPPVLAPGTHCSLLARIARPTHLWNENVYVNLMGQSASK